MFHVGYSHFRRGKKTVPKKRNYVTVEVNCVTGQKTSGVFYCPQLQSVNKWLVLCPKEGLNTMKQEITQTLVNSLLLLYINHITRHCAMLVEFACRVRQKELNF